MQTGTPFHLELLGGKSYRIFGVWQTNQHTPSTLSTVLVYTNLYYLPLAAHYMYYTTQLYVEKLVQNCNSIRSKTKSNLTCLQRWIYYPVLQEATCISFQIWLVNYIVWVFPLWSVEWYLWFWIYHTQWRGTLWIWFSLVVMLTNHFFHSYSASHGGFLS